MDSLCDACETGSLSEVEKLTSSHHLSSVNAPRSRDEKTPLFLACEQGHVQVVKHLLTRGATVNQACTSARAMPLHIAAYYSHVDVMTALIEAGADTNCVNRNGLTPLLCACSSSNERGVALLCDNGANVNCTDSKGASAVHYACAVANKAILSALISKNANLSTRDSRGLLPLDFLNAAKGDPECLALLVERGAVEPDYAANEDIARRALSGFAVKSVLPPMPLSQQMRNAASATVSSASSENKSASGSSSAKEVFTSVEELPELPDVPGMIRPPKPSKGPEDYAALFDGRIQSGSIGASKPSSGSGNRRTGDPLSVPFVAGSEYKDVPSSDFLPMLGASGSSSDSGKLKEKFSKFKSKIRARTLSSSSGSLPPSSFSVENGGRLTLIETRKIGKSKKKLWAVLRNNLLCFFPNETSTGEVASRTIVLGPNSKVVDHDAPAQPLQFVVVDCEGKRFKLEAGTSEEQHLWTHFITERLETMNKVEGTLVPDKESAKHTKRQAPKALPSPFANAKDDSNLFAQSSSSSDFSASLQFPSAPPPEDESDIVFPEAPPPVEEVASIPRTRFAKSTAALPSLPSKSAAATLHDRVAAKNAQLKALQAKTSTPGAKPLPSVPTKQRSGVNREQFSSAVRDYRRRLKEQERKKLDLKRRIQAHKRGDYRAALRHSNQPTASASSDAVLSAFPSTPTDVPVSVPASLPKAPEVPKVPKTPSVTVAPMAPKSEDERPTVGEPIASTTISCRKCKASLPGESLFCLKCGTSTSTSSSVKEEKAAAEEADADPLEIARLESELQRLEAGLEEEEADNDEEENELFRKLVQQAALEIEDKKHDNDAAERLLAAYADQLERDNDEILDAMSNRLLDP